MIREQIGIIRIIPGTDERKVCDHTIRMRKAVCLGMDPTTDGFFVPDHSYNGKYTSLRTMGCRFDSCMVYSAAYAAETIIIYG